MNKNGILCVHTKKHGAPPDKKTFIKEKIKMKKVLSIIVSIAMLICALALVSCGEKQDELIVYTEAGFAPWEFTAKGKTDVIGVDMEIAKYIADKYGYKLKVINGTFDAIVAGISEDNALGIAGISWNADRANAVEFSKFYWGDAFQAVVYLKASNPTLVVGAFAVSNFEGKSVTYQTGTTSQLTISENKATWKISDAKDFTEVLSALEAVKGHNDKYLIVDSQVAAQLVAANPDFAYAQIEGLEAEQYGVVAKKGNTALIEKVNAALDELLVKDSSGKNQIDKWFEKYSAIEPAE